MAKRHSQLEKRFVVKPGGRLHLAGRDPDDTAGIRSKEQCEASLAKNVARLFELQTRLGATREQAVLVVLQAMDAGGKDGTIRHVMTGLNPQACRVTSFKVPSSEEADHDFLWRIHHAAPRRGEIGIFNRSHYEDVLVVRVHKLAPKETWSARFAQINDFEKTLSQNRTIVLKFFLHISREEQAKRLLERIDDPQKNWKISPADLAEREYWDDYMEAYEEALERCSTKWAPWYVIPANKKWFRNLAVSQIIVDRMERLEMNYPPLKVDLAKLRAKFR
jgi:PPK2 family polyphosphate:nucleotide phosphotransferase